MVKLHIGFDDTDSPNGGCTTYIAAILTEKLSKMNISFIDYPNLIRLNPNAPWKTRGNGALCLRLNCPQNNLTEVKEIVIKTVETYAEMSYDGTDPGIVFLHNDIPKKIREFAKKAEQSLLKLGDALKLAKSVNCEVLGFKRGRGIIGGLAAIGEKLDGDHTFELITYRTIENRNKSRRVQTSSILSIDKKIPLTFNNVDPETGRILITPRGPDPILYGIRGESPEIVKKAHKMVRTDEPVERWTIFRTNQGTDAHLQGVKKVNEIKSYNPVVVQGFLSNKPRIIQGGHVIFSIMDATGEVDCAAYKPTVILCKIAGKLIPGDILKVYGGVRQFSECQLTINLEKIELLELVPRISFLNPKCQYCGKRMKSMGKNQGFRCDRCGFRSSKQNRLEVYEERKFEKKLYIVSPRSQRHLTKPHCRYGREKFKAKTEMIKKWHVP